MNYEIISWLAALVVFAIVEGATVSLVSIWFVGGSAAALLTAILGGPIWLQFILFFAVSIALLAALRPFLRKYVNPHRTPTNADRNIGRIGTVLEKIDNIQSTGRVKVAGMEWTARSVDGSTIEKDTLVVVRSIEGAKLCVERQPAAAHNQ